MAEVTNVVSTCGVTCGVTYRAPNVHVAFIGTKGKESTCQTIQAELMTLSANTTIKETIAKAASERFMITSEDAINPVGLNIGNATIYRSTALTIAPQFKVTDSEAPVIIEAYDETDPRRA